MILLKLFLVFFKVGLFAIGGAYSFLPLVEQEVVQGQRWMSKSEFLEVTGMVEIFPGAISIKFATYTGYQVAGIPGAIIANIANLLPPVLFIMMASLVYSRYRDAPRVGAALQMVRYAVFAMIVAIAIRLVDKGHLLEPKVLLVVAVSFLLLTLTKTHPALVIIGAAVFGGMVK
ncbi:MAG: chromate transporter [Sedimentisphaerales bacterium]|nr:chromate transporter [Sedimentisphaerales bacterium]